MLFNHGAKGGVGRWPAARAGAWLLVFVLIGGCSHLPPSPAASVRPFSFEKDTLAYPNELVLEYHYAANGDWTKHPRHPKPTYALHCFVVTRTALQFFKHAKFDPAQPKADEATYAKLIGNVVSTSVRKTLSDDKKIIIPGYANL